ncbi:hypothetical protein ABMC88_11465 [Sulfitobacter sp. HNIBRBA2951]|uniref:hypothetical protein n=1 Tax=Sulfitobacter aquimarinus TaxID=3158557 RepID=UPI0032E01A45
MRSTSLKYVAAASALLLFACDDAAGPTASGAATNAAVATGGPKKAGQICLLQASQCEAFSKSEDVLLRVLNMDPKTRNPIDEQSFQVILKALVDGQAAADQNCTPASGSLTRKAKLVSKTGQTALLMGKGASVCALIPAK